MGRHVSIAINSHHIKSTLTETHFCLRIPIYRSCSKLEPLGSGVFFTEEDNGEVDATYIVTENRGRLKARFLATNILADRTDMLEQIGLDPRAMLRQDRLLQDELGFLENTLGQ